MSLLTRRRIGWTLGALAVLAAGLAALVAWLNVRGETPLQPDPPAAARPSPELVARGAYLARVGNCIGCHTARGGTPWAGGRSIATPFGTLYAGNLTPHATGLGGWTQAEFRRALQHGRSRDGRLLYPAFPYPSFTRISNEDADALLAFLRSLAPVDRPATPHALRFPYDLQASLAVWRALYFRPQPHIDDPQQDAAWNRGAYLVRGLGHCAECHAPRNAMGALASAPRLEGGMIPMQQWYAPSLLDPAQAGVGSAPAEHAAFIELMQTGRSGARRALGPMAEVVFDASSRISRDDLQAMARYLSSPGGVGGAATRAATQESRRGDTASSIASRRQQGRELYETHCMSCHGRSGEGLGPYAPLARQPAVTLETPVNLLHTIIEGGFAPTTAGNPRPYGMPPFGQLLSDEEIAAVATYVRSSWGNESAPVSAIDVQRLR